MRRMVAVGAAGLTAICVAVAVTAGAIAPAAPASSGEGCTWHRHSKRVVKQVKRHGRLRKVRRVKRWWTCDLRTRTTAPAAVPAPAPVTESPPEEETQPQVSHLSVKALEWSYTLSRPEVPAGEVIVELNNQGEDGHNLKLQREGSEDPPLSVPYAEPAEHTEAQLTLSPGSYRLYCSLPQHDAKGMHATLAVGG